MFQDTGEKKKRPPREPYGRYTELVDYMIKHRRAILVEEIYAIVCKPTGRKLSVVEMYTRISRALGKARVILEERGFRVERGVPRNSYYARKVGPDKRRLLWWEK